MRNSIGLNLAKQLFHIINEKSYINTMPLVVVSFPELAGNYLIGM